MIIRLLRDIDPPFGLFAGMQLETYEDFGAECGKVDVDEDGNETPNYKVWIECPRSPDWYRWKSAFRLVSPSDFAVVEEEETASRIDNQGRATHHTSARARKEENYEPDYFN